ncbi:hypothetical protein NX773_06250 [Massilia solisilvae]|uniref:OmpA family protein n=1 Tax=Massilia solisilvae TaxID=1811225 RepID=A0ABT2BGX8_9BURK|nr:OmpA family protein [Massilia solisilvae]MCS0607761.1 hypothetical protein [Massilia solisilvae]
MAATSLAVAIPLAIAVYSGWQQHKACIGDHDPRPVVENFCSGLRQSLNETCSAMLSVPLPGNYFQLRLGEAIKPVKFDDFTRETIRETYTACTNFWGGDPSWSYPRYLAYLNERASVLDLLLAQVKLPGARAQTSAALAGQGASPAVAPPPLNKTIDKICEATGGCPAGGGAGQGLSESEVKQIVNTEVAQLSAELRDAVDERIAQSNMRITDQLLEMRVALNEFLGGAGKPRAPGKRLVAEVAFATASAKISDQDCDGLARMVTSQLPAGSEVTVIGSADARGTAADNKRLSERRAQRAAACLSRHPAWRGARIQAHGDGVLGTLPSSMSLARKAAIYIAPPVERTAE